MAVNVNATDNDRDRRHGKKDDGTYHGSHWHNVVWRRRWRRRWRRWRRWRRRWRLGKILERKFDRVWIRREHEDQGLVVEALVCSLVIARAVDVAPADDEVVVVLWRDHPAAVRVEFELVDGAGRMPHVVESRVLGESCRRRKKTPKRE